jgi:hypothetical protein
MARRRRSALTLSGDHARQALAILVQEGRLKATEVKKALQRRDRLIRALRASLSALETGAVSAQAGHGHGGMPCGVRGADETQARRPVGWNLGGPECLADRRRRYHLRVTHAAYRHDRAEHEKRDTQAEPFHVSPLSKSGASVIIHGDYGP